MGFLNDFLIEAKKSTYANSQAKRQKGTRTNSKDYEFEKNNMIYHDTYFGSTKFIGEEVVYVDNETYWAMNYYGTTLVDDLEEEVMDQILRPALMQVGEDKEIIPVRGPRKFISGEYVYTFEIHGGLNYFSGIECIYKNDAKIYELHCHGGIIK